MSFRQSIIGTVICCAFIVACGHSGQNRGGSNDTSEGDLLPDVKGLTINEFAWLAGWWQQPTDNGIMFEEWLPVGDILSGRAGEIDGADTAISETISIRLEDSAVIYIPVVKGQNGNEPIIFRLTYYSKDSIVFSNPHHDFPQIISYSKLAADTFAARISAMIERQEKAARFVMYKAH